MGTAAAPRIDERLRRYISGAPLAVTPAQVTRDVGDLAWQLGLPRPSYQQVRVRLGRLQRVHVALPATQTSKGRVVLHRLARAVDVLYEYPAHGLEGWYRRYARGPVPGPRSRGLVPALRARALVTDCYKLPTCAYPPP